MPNPPDGAIVDYVVGGGRGRDPWTLEIRDSAVRPRAPRLER
jgi:hypothetical protein